jgi:hypothetical protein
MTEYALVGPDNSLLRTASNVDPNVQTKPGFRWLRVVREYGSPFEGVENDRYVIRTVDPATLPPPVPFQISDRQFFHALALNKAITEEEALAAVKTGEIPATLKALVDQLPDKFGAEMLISGATIFQRNHPLTDALGAAMGYSPEQIDGLFRQAGAL